MKARSAARLAWGLWALSVGGLAAVLTVGLIEGQPVSSEPGGTAPFVAVVAFILAFSTVGALVASKRPSSPIGWLLSAAGLCYGGATAATVLSKVDATRVLANWVQNWIWGLGLGLPVLMLLLFPTGTLPSRRWRPVVWIAAIGMAGFVLGNAFAPGVIPDTRSQNPVGIPALRSVLGVFRGGFGLVLLALLAGVASIGLRYRRAQAVERQQLKWLVYAVGLIVLALVAQAIVGKELGSTAFSTNVQNAITAGALAFVPVAIGAAILKHRLYDIDVVINRTVVFGALAAFITGIYVAIVVGIGTAIGQGSRSNVGLSIVATSVVAVAFQPVRERVQRFANRLVYGKRATPYEVLAGFVRRVGGTYAAEDVLSRMARALAEGSGALRASVWLKVGTELRPEAVWPPAEGLPSDVALPGDDVPALADASLTLPVRYRGDLLGALSLAKRPGEPLTPTEEKLARDLAGQAGLVLRNVGLTEELMARLRDLEVSRSRMVSAEEEERRRLESRIRAGARRELEQTVRTLDRALPSLRADPDEALRELGEVAERAGRALESLREVARGVYPPLLADRGLVMALEAQARRYDVPVVVEAGALGRYEPEVEASLYFCCLEALQNAAAYAGATAIRIRVAEQQGAVAFEVWDDGSGFNAEETGRGLGLTGMIDRVSALDGSVQIESRPGDGTTVHGWVPVASDEPAGQLEPVG